MPDSTHFQTAPEIDVEGYEQEELSFEGFPIESIMIRSEGRSVFEVSRRIKNGNYIMDPDFQRDFVWDHHRQSKLIESALLRIPLPVFYLAETREGKTVVVDGLQRLTTFHRFLENEFKLKGMEFLSDLNGKKFRDLSPLLQNRIEDTQLQLYLIDSQVPETAKYEIFERVNSGVPLTRQQMRNCLFVGDATAWLGKMAHHSDFLKATGSSLNSKTMRDRECINRFAAFHVCGWRDYSGKMDSFLGETLSKMNQDCDSDALSKEFLRSMRLNTLVQGEHAGKMTGPAHGAAINLGQREIGVVCSDDCVRRPANADAAADDEFVDGSYYGHFGIADRFESQIVAAVEHSNAIGVRLHLLDIHAAAKAPAFRADKNAVHFGVAARFSDYAGKR